MNKKRIIAITTISLVLILVIGYLWVKSREPLKIVNNALPKTEKTEDRVMLESEDFRVGVVKRMDGKSIRYDVAGGGEISAQLGEEIAVLCTSKQIGISDKDFDFSTVEDVKLKKASELSVSSGQNVVIMSKDKLVHSLGVGSEICNQI